MNFKNEEDATRLLNDTYQFLDEHDIRDLCPVTWLLPTCFEVYAVRNAKTGMDAFKMQHNAFLLFQS